MEYEEMTDDELREIRRNLDKQIIPLERKSKEIARILDRREAWRKQREANSAIDNPQSISEFQSQLDAIGTED